jgi:hypothetical protein
MIDDQPKPAVDPVWIEKCEVVYSKWAGLKRANKRSCL